MLIRVIRYLFAHLYTPVDEFELVPFLRYLATIVTVLLVLALIRYGLNSSFPGHHGLMWLGELLLLCVGGFFLIRTIRRDKRNFPTG